MVQTGIYGGKVKRDADGNVLTGRQYENHNPTDGPMYAGNGYTEVRGQPRSTKGDASWQGMGCGASVFR